MAPPVYTEFLGNLSITPGHTITLGPVPAGVQWIVVDLQLRLVNDNEPQLLGVVIGLQELNQLSWQCPPYGRRSVHWSGRQVVESGQSVQVICEGTSGDGGEINGSMTGYVLTLP